MKHNSNHEDRTRQVATSSLEAEIERSRRIDQYQIIAKLGKGGMGVVYKALDTRIKRIVAIKLMLDSAFAQPAALKRFWREMQIGSRLDHPHIVKVYHIASIGNIPYMVLEYIEGTPLLSCFEAGGQQLPKKLAVIAQIATALEHAQRHKIIHRDIKPSNIMIRDNGQPVLLDFGLAKANEVNDHSLTKSGQVIGTPQYMAPEQAQGRKREIDYRSDIYGLGAVLYHLLTGHPPASGDTLMEVLHQVVNKKPVPPRALHPEIAAAVEKICLRALEKKKKNRYASAQALAKDIELYLHKRTPTAVWFYRRQKLFVGLGLLLGVAALIMAAWGSYRGYRIYASNSSAMEQLQQAYAQGKELARSGSWDQAYVKFYLALSLVEKRQQQSGNKDDTWSKKVVNALLQTYYRQGQQKLQQIPEEAEIYFRKAQSLQEDHAGQWSKADYLGWQQKLQLASLAAYFASRAYSQAYKLAQRILAAGYHLSKEERQLILWTQARAAYHSNVSKTEAHLLDLRRQTKPQQEAHIGAIYYLGRIALQANNISQAKKHFAAALALLEKYSSPCPFRAAVGLYFCNTLLAATEGELTGAERSAFARYFPHDAADLRLNNIYRETMARYHLRSAQGEKADKKESAQKAIQLLDGCLDDIPNNSEYYYLRGQANVCLANYPAAIADFSTALNLAPHRLNIFIKKLELLSVYVSPSQLTEYNQDFTKYFGEAFNVKPNMFSSELNDERRKLLLMGSEGAIPFSPAKFLLFYQRLISGSVEVRKMAIRAICSLQPSEKVIQAIAARRVVGQKQTELIAQLHAQLGQAMQQRYEQKFLYGLAQLSCYGRLDHLAQYHNPRAIALLQKIVASDKYSIYLRFLGARVLVHLPGLQWRRWLLEQCHAKSNSDITTIILVRRVLHETAFSDFDWHTLSRRCPAHDEFLQVLLLEMRPNKSPRLLEYLRQKLNAPVPARVKIMAASCLPGNKKLAALPRKILLEGHKDAREQVRAYCIRALWDPLLLIKPANWRRLADFLPMLLQATRDISPLVQQVALNTLRQLSQFLTMHHQKITAAIRRILADSQHPLMRCRCIITLAELQDSASLQGILANPKTSFLERIAILIGFVRSDIGIKKRNKKDLLEDARRMKAFLDSDDIAPRARSMSLYLMSLSARQKASGKMTGVTQRILHVFIRGRIEKLLDSNDAFVVVWSLLTCGHLREISPIILAKIERIWRQDSRRHLRLLAFAMLINISHRERLPQWKKWHGWVEAKLRQNRRENYEYGRAAVWGYTILLDENMKPSVDSYQKLDGDPELVWRYRVQSLRLVARARPLRRECILRLQKALHLLKYISERSLTQEYSYFLAHLYAMAGHRQQAIDLLAATIASDKQINARLACLWGELMLQSGQGNKALETLEQWRKNSITPFDIVAQMARIYVHRQEWEKANQLFQHHYGLSAQHHLVLLTAARTCPLFFVAAIRYIYRSGRLDAGLFKVLFDGMSYYFPTHPIQIDRYGMKTPLIIEIYRGHGAFYRSR